MDNTRLNKWAELLLDTGRRNNLINFRDKKNSTLEVLEPDFDELFEKITNFTTLEVFEPDIKVQANIFEELEDEVVIETKQSFKEKYAKKLKKNQILCYNKNISANSSLNQIAKKVKNVLEETGVNIGYMAFGFINYTEKENDNLTFKAPILLVPISFEKATLLSPYKINIIGDDIVLNPTFAFKFKNEYKIELPEYDDEPIDEYFEKILSIISANSWSIEKECKIDTFSFLKNNMYRDLKDNAERILGNKNVRKLLNEKTGVETQVQENNEQSQEMFDLLTLNNVVDADSSQAEAILMAKEGKSFVLQGPPGTGKSQTITNIIAECIGDGKKVLFVSEKQAALNVVYDKLKKAELEEFCLELHSHKANKKDIINDLCKTLREPKKKLSLLAKVEMELKEKAREELDKYATELHKKNEGINKSAYELYGLVNAYTCDDDFEFVIDDIAKKDEKYIEKVEDLLKRYEEFFNTIGYDYRQNVWYGYVNQDTSYETSLNVKQDLKDSISYLNGLKRLYNQILIEYDINANSVYLMDKYKEFFELVKGSKFLTASLFNKENCEKVFESVNKLSKLTDNILLERSELSQKFDSDIYKIDGRQIYKLLNNQYDGFFSRLFGREYKEIIKSLNLCVIDGKKVKYKDALKFTKILKEEQENVEAFNSEALNTKEFLTKEFKGIGTDWAVLKNEIGTLNSLFECGISFGNLENSERNFDEIKVELKDKAESLEKLETTRQSFDRINSCFDKTKFNFNIETLDNAINKATACDKETDKLSNWCRFVALLSELEGLNLKDYIDYTIEKNIKTENISKVYLKALYTTWLYYLRSNSSVLADFNRFSQDNFVKAFCEKDKLDFDINKAEIQAKLSANRPNLDMIAEGSAVAILRREGEKKRKQKNIRRLFSEIGELVQLLKPCFLMSPLSVSTYLNAEEDGSYNMSFDTVIFDEASQIFPQDAIGAIYRGSQLIVVGDSKQMPPSNFFNASFDVGDDDEFEDEDVTDFESILDICSASFNQKRLKWHYRSKNEGLIAFSNKNYYDNELVTFPSTTDSEKEWGVEYVKVDGIFDRKSRTNRVEAEKVVDLIYENLKKNPNKTLGVVAFSISQQSLIERILLKRRREDAKDNAEYFSSDRFFIKNLETVQGDERDIIIFSVAYAKDVDGRFIYNFGPLNREGGERRLNVAVTRAKEKVQLVSSFSFADIDLSRTNSLGVKLLKEYLEYAECGRSVLEREQALALHEWQQADFENEVSSFLKENGYIVEAKVGCSSFRIDLAIKEPISSKYLIAIECDGESYYTSKTTRDRDRLREEALTRMGWKYYRIWSTDWFFNKKIEQERLLEFCKSIVNSEKKPQEVVEVKPQEEHVFEEVLEEEKFEFKPYEMADIDTLFKQNRGHFKEFIVKVLEVESPLAENFLLKRIVKLFNREKVTSTFKKEYEVAMLGIENYGVIRQNGFLYLKNQSKISLRVPQNKEMVRDIKDISLNELASGIYELIKQNVTVEKGGLFKTLSKALGFSRVTETITERLEKALGLLYKKVEEKDNILSIIK